MERTSCLVSSLTVGRSMSNLKSMLPSLPVMSRMQMTFALLFWLKAVVAVRSLRGTELMVWWQTRWMFASKGLPLNSTIEPGWRARSRKMMSWR